MGRRLPWLVALSLALVLTLILTGFSIQKEVELVFNDGTPPITVKVWGGTLSQAVEKAGLSPEELVQNYVSSLPLDTAIQQDTLVEMKRIYQVTLNDAGQEKTYRTTQQTVGSFLLEQGIQLGAEDQISPEPDAAITPYLHIRLDRYQTQVEQRKELLAYQTIEKKDSNLLKGKTRVQQPGKEGYRLIEITKVVKNGEVVSTQERVVEEVKPQEKIVLVGTKVPARDTSTLVASRSASRRAEAPVEGTIAGMPYYKALKVHSTAYTHTGRRTATGVMPTVGTVAVDPRVIPYGTKMYIPGYGVGIAQDTGGAIVGNRIDVFFNTQKEALNWGRRTITIYLLK